MQEYDEAPLIDARLRNIRRQLLLVLVAADTPEACVDGDLILGAIAETARPLMEEIDILLELPDLVLNIPSPNVREHDGKEVELEQWVAAKMRALLEQAS